MRISIQFKPTIRYDLDFGYHTPLFRKMYWFTITTVYLYNRSIDGSYVVQHARLHVCLLKHYKYWSITTKLKFIMIKLIIYFIVILLLLTSCSSFFLHNIEQYDKMYVTDTTGCRLSNVRVITTKTERFNTEVLSFIAITNRDTIQIPLLKWDWNNPPYHGKGLNGKFYTVYYEGKKSITIYSKQDRIVLSRINNCK